MSQLARALKDEIIRLARRELKKGLVPIQRTSARQRKDIASLKRLLAQMERQIKKGATHGKIAVVDPTDDSAKLRFRADGFRTLRQRLGLSAEQTAKLLGVSAQSVYLWEKRKTTPRRAQLPAIAALRSMGKREVMQRLEQSKT